MKKILLSVAFVATSLFATAQVGVATTLPKATLDVVGEPSDDTVADGIITPRLSAVELGAKEAAGTYVNADNTATMVYVTDAAAVAAQTGALVNVTAAGLYYRDAAGVWQSTGVDDHLGDVDQTLSARRTIDFDGNDLVLDLANDGSNQVLFDTAGRLALGLDGGQNSSGLISAIDGMAFISDTNNNTNNATIRFGHDGGRDTGTGDVNFVEDMRIVETGNVGIGVTDPQAKLDVDGGTIRLRTLPGATLGTNSSGDIVDLGLDPEVGVSVSKIITKDALPSTFNAGVTTYDRVVGDFTFRIRAGGGLLTDNLIVLLKLNSAPTANVTVRSTSIQYGSGATQTPASSVTFTAANFDTFVEVGDVNNTNRSTQTNVYTSSTDPVYDGRYFITNASRGNDSADNAGSIKALIINRY